MLRPLRIFVSLFLLVAVVPTARASATKALPIGHASDAPRVADESVLDSLAAKALSKDWGVPLREARKRIVQQRHLGEIAAEAMNLLGDSYAGIWIEHKRGGEIVINTSDPGRTSVQLHAPDDVKLRIQRVVHSLTELRYILKSLSGKLARANARALVPIAVGIPIASNRVEVSLPPAGKVTVAQSSFIRDAQERFAGALLVNHEAVPTSGSNHDGLTRDCDRYTWDRDACDNPLRGGIHLQDAISGCTGGFNANSAVDGKPYLVTAGHCLDANTGNAVMDDPAHETETWQQIMHFDWLYHTIGRNHSHRLDTTGDMAILHVNNPTGWGGTDGDPDPWVVVLASQGGTNTSENFQYYLDGIGIWADVGINGGYICSTGATSGTRCGQITAINQTRTYLGRLVGNLAQVSYSTCGGDSGGPVYKNRLAFGITVARDGTGSCGSPSYYQGASGIEAALNVWILTRSRD